MQIDPNRIQWDPPASTAAPRYVPVGPQAKPPPKVATPLAPETSAKTVADTTRTQQEIRQYSVSKEDQARIDAMRQTIGNIDEVIRDIRNGAKAIDRFGGGPGKAFVSRVATPKADPEKSGLWDQLGGKVFGGLVSEQDKRDYQLLEYLKNRAVLSAQIAQKGPQTESDAVRMAMTGIQPGNYKEANAKILGEAMLRAQLLQRKPGFYTRWAQKYGSLTGLDPKGRSVDDAWNLMATDAFRRNQSRGDPSLVSRAKTPSREIHFNDLPD